MSTLRIPNVVLARHGEFHEYEDRLNAAGVVQAETLADRIAGRFSSVAMFSSYGPRSMQHAEIAGRILGVTSKPLEAFTPANSDIPEGCIPRAIQFLEEYSGEEDAVCIVARGGVVASLASHIGKNALGLDFDAPQMQYGQALVIQTEPGYIGAL